MPARRQPCRCRWRALPVGKRTEEATAQSRRRRRAGAGARARKNAGRRRPCARRSNGRVGQRPRPPVARVRVAARARVLVGACGRARGRAARASRHTNGSSTRAERGPALLGSPIMPCCGRAPPPRRGHDAVAPRLVCRPPPRSPRAASRREEDGRRAVEHPFGPTTCSSRPTARSPRCAPPTARERRRVQHAATFVARARAPRRRRRPRRRGPRARRPRRALQAARARHAAGAVSPLLLGAPQLDAVEQARRRARGSRSGCARTRAARARAADGPRTRPRPLRITEAPTSPCRIPRSSRRRTRDAFSSRRPSPPSAPRRRLNHAGGG